VFPHDAPRRMRPARWCPRSPRGPPNRAPPHNPRPAGICRAPVCGACAAGQRRLGQAGAGLVRHVNDIAQFPLTHVVAVHITACPGTAPPHQPTAEKDTSHSPRSGTGLYLDH